MSYDDATIIQQIALLTVREMLAPTGILATRSNLKSSPVLDKELSRARLMRGGIKLEGNVVVNALDVSNIQGITNEEAWKYDSPVPLTAINYPWYAHQWGYKSNLLAGITGIQCLPNDLIRNFYPIFQPEKLTYISNNVFKSTLTMEQIAEVTNAFNKDLAACVVGNGTGDVKKLAGLRSILTDVNNTGTVGGISRATYPNWRHNLGTVTIELATYDPSKHLILNGLSTLLLKCSDNGGYRATPDKNRWLIYCGTVLYDYLRKETESRQSQQQGDFALYDGTRDATMVGEISAAGITIIPDSNIDDQGDSFKAMIVDTHSIQWNIYAGSTQGFGDNPTLGNMLNNDRALEMANAYTHHIPLASTGENAIVKQAYLFISGYSAIQLNTSGLFNLVVN